MANYDKLRLTILDITKREEFESIIEKIVNDNNFYELLLSQKNEAYLEYTKKNRVIIYCKSGQLLEIMNNLEKYSEDNPEINIEFTLSFEYDYWSTGKKYLMKGGESKLIKLSNYGMVTYSKDYPESVFKLYEEGVNILKKLDKKDYNKGEITYYPHPIEIELKDDKFKVKIRKDDLFYSLTSFEELTKPELSPAEQLPF